MAFADLTQQENVVNLLQRSLERGRLGHAYLFSGEDLAVLETAAGSLAKTLNCTAPVTGEGDHAIDSCDQCVSCRRIDHLNHADVRWVRPESKSRIISIDQMRDLMKAVNLKPSESRWKIGVIVGADRLNVQGANAFLKTLEEPPSQSLLILLTTQPQRLLDTILSRCLRLHFAGEAAGQGDGPEDWIKDFAARAADPAADIFGRYHLLGLLTNRLATLRKQTLKEQDERSPLEQYRQKDVELDPKLEERLLKERDAAAEAEYRRLRTDLLAELQRWFRDVWVLAQTRDASLVQQPALANAAQSLAGRLRPGQAQQNLEVLDRAQRLLFTNVQEALALEVAVLQLTL